MQAKACVLHGQKDLRIESVAVPELKPNQVLVRIGAGGICGSDLHYYLDGGFGVVRVKEPIVLGPEVAGTIEKVGSEVHRLQRGGTAMMMSSNLIKATELAAERKKLADERARLAGEGETRRRREPPTPEQKRRGPKH